MNEDEDIAVGIENITVVVADAEALQKRYGRIQARIDAAELLGIDISEYNKEASRPVRLSFYHRGFHIPSNELKTHERH